MASVSAKGLQTAVRKTTSSMLVATTKHSMKGRDASFPNSRSVDLMYRAGLIHQSSSGVYSWLPFGLRVMDKLVRVVDREMERVGGSRMLLPSLLPQDLWMQSGRLEEMGSDLFKLADRHSKPFLLAPTHEESITDLIASRVSSHKQLPLRLYQVSVKFRDEERPRYGLLRCKEFWMKDMYSFDIDKQAALRSYELVREAYKRIFQRLEQPVVEVQASTGVIGGEMSHEYHVTAPIGEDTVITCPRCDFAINEEMKDCTMGQSEMCPRGQSWASCDLQTSKAIEVGHTFYLGTKYSKVFGATVQNEYSEERCCEMGCYGLGISRILAAVIEQSSQRNKASGLLWPQCIAPFQLCIVPTSSDPEDALTGKAHRLYDYLNASGLGGEIVLEDRHHLSPGRRFKDAELIGYSAIAIVGRKGMEEHWTQETNRPEEEEEEGRVGGRTKECGYLQVEVETITRSLGRQKTMMSFEELRDRLLQARVEQLA